MFKCGHMGVCVWLYVGWGLAMPGMSLSLVLCLGDAMGVKTVYVWCVYK